MPATRITDYRFYFYARLRESTRQHKVVGPWYYDRLSREYFPEMLVSYPPALTRARRLLGEAIRLEKIT